MPVNVIEAKRRKRSTRKTGKSSDGSDDTPRPRKRLIGPEPKPEGDTDGSGRKPVSSKKKKKTPVKPKTPISAKKEGDRKVALDSKRKGTPKGTATGKVFGFAVEEARARAMGEILSAQELRDDPCYDSDDDLIISVLNSEPDTHALLDGVSPVDNGSIDHESDWEISKTERKKLKKTLSSFKKGNIYYSTFVNRVGFDNAIKYEQGFLDSGIEVVPHKSDPLSVPNPFGEDIDSTSFTRLAASHKLARCIQFASTTVPGNPDDPIAVMFRQKFSTAMEGIMTLWTQANKEISALEKAATETPKESPKGQMESEMEVRFKALESELADLKSKPQVNSLDSTVAGMQAKLKPVWGSSKPFNDSKSVTITEFIEAFESCTAAVPAALKLFWLRQRLDTGVLKEFNEIFDPADFAQNKEPEGLVYKRAKVWLGEAYSHPKDEEQLLNQLENCIQADNSVRTYSITFNRFVKRAEKIECDPKPKIQKRMFVKGLKESLREKLIALTEYEEMSLVEVQERLKPLEAADTTATQAHLSRLERDLSQSEREQAMVAKGWRPPASTKPYNKKGDTKPKSKYKFSNHTFKDRYPAKIWKQRQSNFSKGVPHSKYPKHYAQDFIKNNGARHECCVLCHRTGHTAAGHEDHLAAVSSTSAEK
jgi:hypothetical protein